MDECRKAFEKWYQNPYKIIGQFDQNSNGEYLNEQIDNTWAGWKAAWDYRNKHTVPCGTCGKPMEDRGAAKCSDKLAQNPIHQRMMGDLGIAQPSLKPTKTP